MNEDFVPFELAKKLKEKDYPQHIADDAYIVDNYGEEDYQIGDRLPIPLVPDYMDDVSAPTISQVLKWLRKEKKIFILIDIRTDLSWFFEIWGIEISLFPLGTAPYQKYQSYEQATLAGIEYVINNLI